MKSTRPGWAIHRTYHRLIAEGSADLHAVTSLAGTILFVSSEALVPFEWDPLELLGRNHDDFVHPDDIHRVVLAREAAQRGEHTTAAVCRFRTSSGEHRWTECLTRRVDAGGHHVLVTAIRDIGDREIDLRHRASTDALTGVANRPVFMDRLEHAVQRLGRRPGLVAVLFLDLDRFKVINDSLSHSVGDAVLVQAATRVRGVLRPQDTLARLGGDEFAVVIEDLSHADEAVAMGRRINEVVRDPFVLGEARITCTMSVGIAVTNDPHRPAEVTLHEADLALYRAKARGRDRAEMFDDDLGARDAARLDGQRMLRRAIRQGRIRVAYQPIVEVRSGAVVGVEALGCVRDATGALVQTGGLVDGAESVGILPELDEVVLRRALRQAQRWSRRPIAGAAGDGISVAVSITGRHLADPGFAPWLHKELERVELPPHRLQIEIGERVLCEGPSAGVAALRALHRDGVQVVLDGFGTGPSSLSCLRTFPLDLVKLDQSLVAEVERGRSFVGPLIDLCHALGLSVVAEGVERQDQLDALSELGCDRAQGSLFAAAGPPDVVEALAGGVRSPVPLRPLLDPHHN